MPPDIATYRPEVGNSSRLALEQNLEFCEWLVTIYVSVHRAPHLLCCRALEVQGVRLRTLRLVSASGIVISRAWRIISAISSRQKERKVPEDISGSPRASRKIFPPPNGTARYIIQYSKNFQILTNLLSVGMNLAYNSMNPENKPE